MGKGAETVFADISLVVYEQLAAVALGQGVFGYPFVRQKVVKIVYLYLFCVHRCIFNRAKNIFSGAKIQFSEGFLLPLQTKRDKER